MKTKYICSRESGDNPKVKDFRYSVQGHTPYPPNVLPAENTLALPTMCQWALCSSHSTTPRSPVSDHPDACPTLQWSQQASSSHAHHSQVGMGSLGFPGLQATLSTPHTLCSKRSLNCLFPSFSEEVERMVCSGARLLCFTSWLPQLGKFPPPWA